LFKNICAEWYTSVHKEKTNAGHNSFVVYWQIYLHIVAFDVGGQGFSSGENGWGNSRG